MQARIAHAASGWNASTRVCVALSGGLDSTVLLHALAAARAAQIAATGAAWHLTAHHVHHGLSPNADAWLTQAAALCDGLGVAFTSERVQVDRASPIGIEAAAREARYASLARVSCDVLALAHHQRDQAETVLLQLLRGAGPAGLSAMPAASAPKTPTAPGNGAVIVRPLLECSRTTLAAYAQAFQLRWIEDESNADPRFARNRLRQQVWPSLLAAFPAAETTLARAAAHQADADTLLSELASHDAQTCIDGRSLLLAPMALLSLPRRANLLRHWLATLGLRAPATETLHEWLRQLSGHDAGPGTQAISLRVPGMQPGAPAAASVRVYRGRAALVPDARAWPEHSWTGEAVVQLACEYAVAGCVEFTPSTAAGALRSPQPDERWTLRRRAEGDRIRLSAHSGQVTLKNVFQSSGIPPWQRADWPVLCCNGTVVAVVGVATASAYTVSPGATGWLCRWQPAPWKPA